MNIELFEQHSFRNSGIFFKNVGLLKIIKIDFEFLIVTLSEFIYITRALLLLDSLSVLQYVHHVLVEFIAEVSI